MNTTQLQHLLQKSPAEKRRRIRAASKIAQTGAQDVTYKMIRLRDRFQYQKSDVRHIRTTDDVPGTYRTRPRKKNKVEYIPDTTTHATLAISYSESVAHYFKQHEVSWYYNEAISGTGFRRMDATAVILQAANAGV